MYVSLSMLMLSFGVAADTFAASISKGLRQSRPSTFNSFCIAGIFSLMEMAFLYVGHVLGYATSQIIIQVDHWIAFVVLTLLGIKMIKHHPEKSILENSQGTVFNPFMILVTSVGTSIDSIAVGISTAFIKMDIMMFISMTGLLVFCLSFIGSRFVARALGYKLGNVAEKIGGTILISIGITILFSHLGIRLF